MKDFRGFGGQGLLVADPARHKGDCAIEKPPCCVQPRKLAPPSTQLAQKASRKKVWALPEALHLHLFWGLGFRVEGFDLHLFDFRVQDLGFLPSFT